MNESIGFWLKKAMLECDKHANQLLAEHDLTHTQYKILMIFYSNPPMSVRQIDLERHFSMTNPTITGILHNMERKDLIRRVPNPMDKRSKVIALTPKAMLMREEMYEWSDQIDDWIVSKLTGEETEQLILLLKKIMGPV